MALDRGRYQRRRIASSITVGLCWAATALGLTILGIILATLLYKGVAGLGLNVFTEMTPPPGSDGGLLNAIAGSLVMTDHRRRHRNAGRHPRRHVHGGIRPL